MKQVWRAARDCVKTFVVRSQIWHRGEKSPCVRVARIVEYILDRAALDDLACIHDVDIIGNLRNDAQIVRDIDNRQLPFFLNLLNQFQNLRLNRNVQRRRRLVAD